MYTEVYTHIQYTYICNIGRHLCTYISFQLVVFVAYHRCYVNPVCTTMYISTVAYCRSDIPSKDGKINNLFYGVPISSCRFSNIVYLYRP